MMSKQGASTGPRRIRVDPFGALHAVVARDGWMGNRGCLHDDAQQIVRHHKGRRWITCRLAFGGRRRDLMAPGRYTELFFADEATAYAAGHRPCAECRRAAYRGFQALWRDVHGGGTPPAEVMDRALHSARIDKAGARVTYLARRGELPDGVIWLFDGAPVLVARGRDWRWGFDDYTPLDAVVGAGALVPVLTPRPIVALIAAGLPMQMANIGQVTPHDRLP